jgi:hypothetical protein
MDATLSTLKACRYDWGAWWGTQRCAACHVLLQDGGACHVDELPLA